MRSMRLAVVVAVALGTGGAARAHGNESPFGDDPEKVLSAQKAPAAEPAPVDEKKTDAAKPADAPTAAKPADVVTPPAAAAAPAAAPAPAKPTELPKKLAVGSEGLFQPGLLFWAWAQSDIAGSAVTSTFKMRRVELYSKGDLQPGRFSYTVMFDLGRVLDAQNAVITVANQDPAATDPKKPETVTVKQPPTGLNPLQDAFVTATSEYVDVQVGQFKIPIGFEAQRTSSAKLLMSERSFIEREYGDKRDVGVRASKAFKSWMYQLDVFNGSGQNSLDTGNGKDFALRLEAYPVKGLTLAGVGYSTVGHREASGAKDRLEADVKWESGNLLALGMGFWGRDMGANGALTFSHGAVAMAGYTFNDVVQPAVRFGYYNPDLDRPLTATSTKDAYLEIAAGANWFIKKQEVKASLLYSRLQYYHKTPADQVVLGLQYWF